MRSWRNGMKPDRRHQEIICKPDNFRLGSPDQVWGEPVVIMTTPLLIRGLFVVWLLSTKSTKESLSGALFRYGERLKLVLGTRRRSDQIIWSD
jgi:hypothetical protein